MYSIFPRGPFYYSDRFKFKILFLSIVFAMLIVSTGCKSNEKSEKPIIVVSILPQKAFVEAVAGDLFEINVMIPAGFSPENYQPTPKILTNLSDASIYFTIGVATESANILPKLPTFNKDIRIVSLWDDVASVYTPRSFEGDQEETDHEEEEHEEEEHDHTGADPHIWLSPKRVKVMIQSIADELSEVYPESAKTFKDNSEAYIQRLDTLDANIKGTLTGFEGEAFIIYHPSFGYFAEDYNLNMITIEEDGKQASAKKIQEVIDFANENDIRFVFYQEEFDSSQAETIAKEIDGTTIKVAPLSENYLENLEEVAKQLKQVLGQK